MAKKVILGRWGSRGARGSSGEDQVGLQSAVGLVRPCQLKLHLADGTQLIAADHPVGTRNGQPLFQLTMAAGTSQTIHYQTEHTVAVSHGHN